MTKIDDTGHSWVIMLSYTTLKCPWSYFKHGLEEQPYWVSSSKSVTSGEGVLVINENVLDLSLTFTWRHDP